MIEQYLYSRSSSDKINSKGQTVKTGFGCIAKSDGVSPEDVRKLEVYANDYDTQAVNSSGCPVSAVMKYQIDTDTVVLSKSARISQSERKAHICHQFLFRGEAKTELIKNPENMFKIKYLSHDVDGEDVVFDSIGEISSLSTDESFALNPDLRETLGYFNFSAESFRDLISAVFDCRTLNRKIIIPVDYSQSDVRLRCDSLLYHILRFLPYQLRPAVGFDTCYSRNSEKSTIDICFVSQPIVKKASSTVYKIGEKNCMYDYVVDSGIVIHTKSDSQPEIYQSHSIFIESLFKMISAEAETGESQTEKLTAFFDTIEKTYQATDENEKLYFSPSLYDTALICDSVLRDKKVGRKHIDKLISDFIRYRECLCDEQKELWIEAIENYFSVNEGEKSDSQVILWLTDLYMLTNEPELKSFSLSLLTQKMLADIQSNGNGEIGRYTDEVISSGIPEASRLLNQLYKNDSGLAIAYIGYYLDTHPTAETVINMAPSFYRDFRYAIPDSEKVLNSLLAKGFKQFHLTPKDALLICDRMNYDNSEFITDFYNRALGYVLSSLTIEKEHPKWFADLKYSPNIKLKNDSMYLTFAVKYLLDYFQIPLNNAEKESISFKEMHVKFASSCLDKEYAEDFISRFYELDSQLRDIIYGMFADMRLELKSHTFKLLYEVSTVQDVCDFSKVCRILNGYPKMIEEYIMFIAALKMPSVNQSEASSTYEANRFLSALKKMLIQSKHEDFAMDIIKCVKALSEEGEFGDYSKKFVSDIFDWYKNSQNPIKKAALTAAKKFIIS